MNGARRSRRLFLNKPSMRPGLARLISFVIASGSERMFVFSDVTNRPELFVRNPGWHAFFDQIPDQAEQTRRKVLDMLIADNMLVQIFHAPFPARGYMEKDGQSYRFVQAPWSPAI